MKEVLILDKLHGTKKLWAVHKSVNRCRAIGVVKGSGEIIPWNDPWEVIDALASCYPNHCPSSYLVEVEDWPVNESQILQFVKDNFEVFL